MGRPKKAKEDLKKKQIPSYYTEKEHDAIKLAAQEVGLTVGEFVRTATLEKIN
jgi:ribosomal protein S19